MYSRKKKVTIIVMLVAVFVMVVGYAAFSVNLVISGTANVASNWNVYISNVETKTVYGKAENVTGSPQFSNLMARMKVNLKEPGDYIIYEITITNGGTLNAIIENIKATNLGTSSIKHTIDGINKGEPIANGETKKFTVTIEYDPTVTSQPDSLENTLILDINCVQDLNQDISGGDIDINAPEIITLSGNNNLTLNNAFPSTLVNYKITGNSIQTLLPNDYQQVEYIETNGEQYINTGFLATDNVKIEGTVYSTVQDREMSIIGTKTSGFEVGYAKNDNRIFIYSLGGSTSVQPTGSIYNKNINFTAVINSNSDRELTLHNVDGGLTTKESKEVYDFKNKEILLFSYVNSYYFVGRLYTLKIYDNDVLVRNFVPCYRKNDGVIGLYDLVTNNFYVNSGTGAFTKGSDTFATPTPNAPVEIQSVGEKTKNLLNNYEVEEYSATPGSLTGAVINSEYIDVVRQTTYDYNLIPVTLEAGKNYTLWAEITVYDRPEEAKDSTVVYFGFRNITSASQMISIYSNTVITKLFNFSVTENTTENLMLYANYGSTVPGKVRFKTMLLEGTYTAENLPDYEPYGYKIPITVGGKNLANVKLSPSKYVTVNEDGSKISLNEVTSGNGYLPTDLKLYQLCPTLKVGTTYTLSATLENATKKTLRKIYLVGSEEFWDYGSTRTITETDLNSDVVFYSNNYASGDTGNGIIINNFQIEEGTVATDYEPYIESSTTDIYLDEPLRKVGDYADYIDFASGTVVRKIVEDNASNKQWYVTGTGENQTMFYYYRPDPKAISHPYDPLCNILQYTGALNTNDSNLGIKIYNYDIARVRPDLSAFPTLEDWKTYLASHDMLVYYAMGTQKVETIDLPQIYIPQGNVKISINSNGLDVPIEVSYYKK